MKHFRDLISNMPVGEQAFTSKRSTWEKYYSELVGLESLVGKVFGVETTVEISRNDLFELANNDNLDVFILSTIMWGYSAGMRGRHFQNLFMNIDVLKTHIEQIRQNDGIEDWNKNISKYKSIPGLGLSTYSKFIYFLRTNVNGYSALILDMRLIDVFCKMQTTRLFYEDTAIKDFDALRNIRYDNAPEIYPQYLKYVNTIALKYDVTPDQLEMFLFEYGSNLKHQLYC